MRANIVIGADHGGFALKNDLIECLKGKYEIVDLGALEFDPGDDYPDIAVKIARAVSTGKGVRGILICGSGVGACIAANKMPGIRACLCHDTYSAHQGVEHDDMNVLCLGARVIGRELARELAEAFLKANFSAIPRHQRRRQKILEIERRYLKDDCQTVTE